MSPKRDRLPSVATYVRSVEQAWSLVAERPIVLSPRDFALLSSWHRRGIPLGIVNEALAENSQWRSARAGRGRLVRLAQIAAAVEESWSVVLDGRCASGSAVESQADRRACATGRWRQCLAREAQGSALGRVLSELLARAERGEAPDYLDAELDRLLPSAVPDALSQGLLQELAGELETYRTRLPPAQLASATRLALIERLRVRLRLPRLSE